MSDPTISIAMTTHNGARYLGEQLNSLASQQSLPIELQIGDDGSTDKTEEIVAEFTRNAPFPVHFHRNDTPLGYGENFIRTALRCQGEWIAFCDQDDIWVPAKLGRCSEEIRGARTDLALLVHDAAIADKAAHPTGRKLYGFRSKASYTPLTLQPEWYALGLTQVFRADLLRELPCDQRASFPWHEHREAHDVWVSLVANITGTIAFIPDALVLYRRHQATASTTAHEKAGASLISGNGRNIGERAAYLNELADLLASCSVGANCHTRDRLEPAIAKLRRQAHYLGLRSAAYTEDAIARRMMALARLLAEGGYFGSAGWPFGAARLVKDAIHAALGPGSGD